MGLFFQGLKTLLIDIFGSLIGGAVRRAPLLTAFFSASVVMIGTYLTAMHTLVAGLQLTVPTVVLQVWGWVMPSNVTLVLTAIYGAKIARWVHIKMLDAMKTKVVSLNK